jgi:hypothetical protein
MALATPAPTPTLTLTPSPTATPSVSASPSASPQSQTLVPQPNIPPTLSLPQYLSLVDPLFWASLLGLIVIPLVLQLLKKWAKYLGTDLGGRVKTLLLGVVSGATAYLLDTVNSGVLDQLHNTPLQLLLTAAVVFVTGTTTYQLVLKKPETQELPTTENP